VEDMGLNEVDCHECNRNFCCNAAMLRYLHESIAIKPMAWDKLKKKS